MFLLIANFIPDEIKYYSINPSDPIVKDLENIHGVYFNSDDTTEDQDISMEAVSEFLLEENEIEESELKSMSFSRVYTYNFFL